MTILFHVLKEKSLEVLIKSLTSESVKAVQWFNKNVIINPNKFQTISIDKKQQNNPTSVRINDININSEYSVKLL